MQTVAVLDFETTGLSPTQGDRATEIAVILLRDGKIVDRFQSLMNAGRRIPSDVVNLTGITNEMIASAPLASKVMREAALFVSKHPVVAHNAGFDRRFWQAELALLGISAEQSFACTMLTSRRIYPHAQSHRLSSLAEMLRLPKSGRAHRAMVDAEMTSHLWHRLKDDIARTYGLRLVDHALIARVQATSKAKVSTLLRSMAGDSVTKSTPRIDKPAVRPRKAWTFESSTSVLRNNATGIEYLPGLYRRTESSHIRGFEILHGSDVWVSDLDVDTA